MAMEELMQILNKFPSKNILVIGDLMLDEYIEGTVERISPEAPIPVILEKKKSYFLGGAGNVASNIRSLGGKVNLFSFVGKDNNQLIIKNLLSQKGISYFLDETNITTTKTRLLGNNQQFLRLDKEETSEKQFSEDAKKKIILAAQSCDIILLSDYAKGTLTKELSELLFPYKQKVIANAKPSNKSFYQGVCLVVLNEKEAKEMSGVLDVENAGEILRTESKSNILITRGERGMILFSNQTFIIPTVAKEVCDVQGAGDTVISAVAMALASGSSFVDAAKIGNYAAGISVEKKGTYSVRLDELKRAVSSKTNKLVTLDELKELVNEYRKENKKIVWTNGCFDLFHFGHKYYLEEAKAQGDILIVGLDSDESVKKLKGPERPIFNQNERAELLSAISFVDYLTILPPGSVKDYLSVLKPDVWVKGGNYNLETLNPQEVNVVANYGGKIFLTGKIPNLSTTGTIQRIRETLN